MHLFLGSFCSGLRVYTVIHDPSCNNYLCITFWTSDILSDTLFYKYRYYQPLYDRHSTITPSPRTFSNNFPNNPPMMLGNKCVPTTTWSKCVSYKSVLSYACLCINVFPNLNASLRFIYFAINRVLRRTTLTLKSWEFSIIAIYNFRPLYFNHLSNSWNVEIDC